MDKPEYCYCYLEVGNNGGVRIHGATWWKPVDEMVKFLVTRNEAGEVIRLERVEG